MTRIEELEAVLEKAKPADTLSDEKNSTGYTRWTERKRLRAISEIDPSKWRKPNGTVSSTGGSK
jgi:hypothetical protein